MGGGAGGGGGKTLSLFFLSEQVYLKASVIKIPLPIHIISQGETKKQTPPTWHEIYHVISLVDHFFEEESCSGSFTSQAYHGKSGSRLNARVVHNQRRDIRRSLQKDLNSM